MGQCIDSSSTPVRALLPAGCQLSIPALNLRNTDTSVLGQLGLAGLVLQPKPGGSVSIHAANPSVALVPEPQRAAPFTGSKTEPY